MDNPVALPQQPPKAGRSDVLKLVVNDLEDRWKGSASWPKVTIFRITIDLVINDLKDRRKVGIAKYGRPLQTHNGRNPFLDAYQEALDLVMYLRQARKEEDGYEPPHLDRCYNDAVTIAIQLRRILDCREL